MNQIPSIFEIPEGFRAALPANVQTWLDSLQARIDGLNLSRIEKEAKGVAGPTEDWKKVYRLGVRVFYARIQVIWDIMYPDNGLEVGIDLMCNPFVSDIPGAAIDQILHSEEPSNRDVLKDCGILDKWGNLTKEEAEELKEAAV